MVVIKGASGCKCNQLHIQPEMENTVTNEDETKILFCLLGTYLLTSKLPADDIGDDCVGGDMPQAIRVSCFVWRAGSKEFTPLVTLGQRKNRKIQLKVIEDTANTKNMQQFHQSDIPGFKWVTRRIDEFFSLLAKFPSLPFWLTLSPLRVIVLYFLFTISPLNQM